MLVVNDNQVTNEPFDVLSTRSCPKISFTVYAKPLGISTYFRCELVNYTKFNFAKVIIHSYHLSIINGGCHTIIYMV